MPTDNALLEGRLTRIETIQENILATLEVMRGDFQDWQKGMEAGHRRTDGRVASLERGESARAELWRIHEEEHKNMSKKSLAGDIVAGLIGSITAALAAIFRP